MKYLAFLITLTLSGVTFEIAAQKTCGSVMNLSTIEKKNPVRYQRIMQIEEQIVSYANNIQQSSLNHQIITIPVVVHVLHTGQAIGTGLNISDAQVQSQIDVLNEDFRRLNTDAANTPPEFQGVAADVEVEFVLACIDPNGNPTNGIRRVQTNKSEYSWEQNADGSNNEVAIGVKFSTHGTPAWPSDRYLNIWVCNLVGNTYGYAQLPDQMASSPNTDGVVIRTTTFGRVGNVINPFDKGRWATHEVGHWLNLRHIWADLYNCNVTDSVADTPNQVRDYLGTPSHPQASCGSNDMFMNYMDYSDDGSKNIFTLGQKDRMRALFAPGGVRESFVSCDVLAQVCETPATISGPSAACTANNSAFTLQNLPAGATVSWTKSSNLAYVSGQNSSTYTVKANGSANGSSGWIRPTISKPGSCNILLPKHDILTVGLANSPPSPSPSYYHNGSRMQCQYISAPFVLHADTYTWTNFNFNFKMNPTYLQCKGGVQMPFASFDAEGVYVSPSQNSTQNFMIYVQSKNGCGTSAMTPIVIYYDNFFGFAALYPNPASSKVVLSFLPEEDTEFIRSNQLTASSGLDIPEYVMTVYNKQMQIIHNETSNKAILEINTSKWKSGTYHVKILSEGKKSITRKLIVN